MACCLRSEGKGSPVLCAPKLPENFLQKIHFVSGIRRQESQSGGLVDHCLDSNKQLRGPGDQLPRRRPPSPGTPTRRTCMSFQVKILVVHDPTDTFTPLNNSEDLAEAFDNKVLLEV